jgi:hypothetical protein
MKPNINHRKPAIIRWIALLAGSELSIVFIGAGIFTGGSFMSGVVGDSATPGTIDGEWIMDLVGILMMFLIPLSVLLAWFRIRTGAFLLTLFAFIHIIVGYTPEFLWLQLAILPVGPLLLYYVSYKKRYEAHNQPG